MTSPFRRIGAPVLALAALLGACATVPANGGPADPAAEARLEAATRPARPVQVFFDWNLTDRDARFSGRGVLRVDPGYRARVDLFGPRGETYAAAIIEGEQMRVVPAGADAMLPPPALLWSSMGVFRRPADAPLVATTVTDARAELTYVRDRTRWQFRFDNDLLRSAEWTDGSGRRTVELGGTSGFALPGQAVFRDWAGFRELTLRVTEVEERAAFDADVWILPGQG